MCLIFCSPSLSPLLSALCITRNGLLLGAAEFGDHVLFQFSGIGDDAAGKPFHLSLPYLPIKDLSVHPQKSFL